MNNFKGGKLGQLMFLVVFLFLAVGCATNQAEVRKPPEGYTIYTDSVSFLWSDKEGFDTEFYPSKRQAVEAAWESYITDKFFNKAKTDLKVSR